MAFPVFDFIVPFISREYAQHVEKMNDVMTLIGIEFTTQQGQPYARCGGLASSASSQTSLGVPSNTTEAAQLTHFLQSSLLGLSLQFRSSQSCALCANLNSKLSLEKEMRQVERKQQPGRDPFCWC